MAGIDRRLRAAMGRVFPAAETVALSPGHVEVGRGLDVGIGPGGGVESLPRQAGDRLRVRLAEYEVHEADSTWLGPVVLGIPPRGRRLVYADSVDLP